MSVTGSIAWKDIRGEVGVGRGMVVIAPSDSADLATTVRSLYVTAAGDVKVKCVDGSIVTLTVPANFVLPVAINRVFVTGTTSVGPFIGIL